MKKIKKIYSLILLTIIVLFPFIDVSADSQSLAIKVEWYHNEDKLDDSPHPTNIKIDPLNNAPMPKDYKDYKEYGDYTFYFSPTFNKAGKYEYLVYLTNEDRLEENEWIKYDKKVYRLVYYVQNTASGLYTSVIAYDNSLYKLDANNTKIASIVFKNIDPYYHDKDANIIKRKSNKPFVPVYPYDPNKNLNTRSDTGDNTKSVDKDSRENVKTGIDSVYLWLLILLLALICLDLLSKKDNEKRFNTRL